MIIIPFEKSFDWRKPPVITFFLIFINSVTLLYTERHDETVNQDSMRYYVDSELPKIELPLYLKMKSDGHGSDSLNQRLAAEIESGRVDKVQLSHLMMKMEKDEAFMEKLYRNEIISLMNPAFAKWKADRSRLDEIENNVISNNYGFIPAEHQPLTFLTNQFLHGGIGHLIGNMLFLFLIGFQLEPVLGGMLYMVFYLLSGLGAVALYWTTYPYSQDPLIGASGAVSGLIGMYAGIFRMQKVRIYVYPRFYPGTIQAPALIILPMWLAIEIYYLYFPESSNVAYMGHVGGLVTGGILGYFFAPKFFRSNA